MPTTVAGVDGCPGGWIVVRIGVSTRHRLLDACVEPTLPAVITSTLGCEAIGIDVPIGLTESERRVPDQLARDLLGPRRSSVFPAPFRAVIHAETQDEATAISKRIGGNGVSAQNFAFIRTKVREANSVMTPALQKRIREVHPEVCFWALNRQGDLVGSKKSPAGALQRLRLIQGVIDFDIDQTPARGKVILDDFLDACAAAWTAARIATGEALTLPEDPETDARGLRMEIVY